MTIAPDVSTHVVDGVLVITIDRPEARNAMTRSAAEKIAAALEHLDSAEGLSAGVLSGSGGVFCAGMDLKAFLKGELPIADGRGFGGIVEAPPQKPIIAAVEGFALAGGFEMALACDLIVAGRSARFGLPEAKRGLVAAAGGLMRLPELIPANVAMELALTGDYLGAERAHALGLVNMLVDDGSALDGAITLGRTIAANGPLATRASKRIIVESRDWTLSERWTRQTSITDAVFESDDAREGALAFTEKRPPKWVGR